MHHYRMYTHRCWQVLLAAERKVHFNSLYSSEKQGIVSGIIVVPMEKPCRALRRVVHGSRGTSWIKKANVETWFHTGSWGNLITNIVRHSRVTCPYTGSVPHCHIAHISCLYSPSKWNTDKNITNTDYLQFSFSNGTCELSQTDVCVFPVNLE